MIGHTWSIYSSQTRGYSLTIFLWSTSTEKFSIAATVYFLWGKWLVKVCHFNETWINTPDTRINLLPMSLTLATISWTLKPLQLEEVITQDNRSCDSLTSSVHDIHNNLFTLCFWSLKELSDTNSWKSSISESNHNYTPSWTQIHGEYKGHSQKSKISHIIVLHSIKCGVIYDTVKCLPHLFWCDCHLHSVIYYTNCVVCTLHFLQCIATQTNYTFII